MIFAAIWSIPAISQMTCRPEPILRQNTRATNSLASTMKTETIMSAKPWTGRDMGWVFTFGPTETHGMAIGAMESEMAKAFS